jgi:hypothetical protein
MTPFAQDLCNALLRRHRQCCLSINVLAADVTAEMVNRTTIGYEALCAEINAAELVRTIGKSLDEIATWCRDSGFPPLNALAVDARTSVPSYGYFEADGCGQWEEEV